MEGGGGVLLAEIRGKIEDGLRNIQRIEKEHVANF
jgi:hypothetical protein